MLCLHLGINNMHDVRLINTNVYCIFYIFIHMNIHSLSYIFINSHEYLVSESCSNLEHAKTVHDTSLARQLFFLFYLEQLPELNPGIFLFALRTIPQYPINAGWQL